MKTQEPARQIPPASARGPARSMIRGWCYTINQVPEGVLGISLAPLGGNGHFRYAPSACKRFLRASEVNPHFKKITTSKSVTSSISCAKKYFEDEGTGRRQGMVLLWKSCNGPVNRGTQLFGMTLLLHSYAN